MAQVKTLNINGSDVADFVIEQGTSDIWTYRKWNSGIAECWGTSSGTTSITTQWYQATMYVADTVFCEKYPSNLFVSRPNIQVTAQANGDGMASWLYAENVKELPTGYTLLNSTGPYRIARPTQAASAPYNIYWHALGKWK